MDIVLKITEFKVVNEFISGAQVRKNTFVLLKKLINSILTELRA